MIVAVRVLARAAHMSIYEFFGVYSPAAWLVAWLPRVVFGALFFGLVAEFAGGHALLLFALVGNAAYLTLQPTLTFTAGSVMSELTAGTLPLLIGTPTNPILVLTGRNAAWGLNGLISGALTLAIAAMFGLSVTPVSFLALVGVLAVIETSAYALGVLIGSLVVRWPGSTNIVPVVVGFTLLVIGGVNVPLDVLPEWVQAIALAAPMTNGLLGMRAILDGDGQAATVFVLAEVLIGCMYLALALLSFRFLVTRTRTAGSFDYQ